MAIKRETWFFIFIYFVIIENYSRTNGIEMEKNNNLKKIPYERFNIFAKKNIQEQYKIIIYINIRQKCNLSRWNTDKIFINNIDEVKRY